MVGTKVYGIHGYIRRQVLINRKTGKLGEFSFARRRRLCFRGEGRNHIDRDHIHPGACTPLVTSLGFPAQVKYDDPVKNTGMQSAGHEAAVIRAFVQRNKQERFLGFLANPKNRKKFTESLSHFRWFDQRFAAPLKWKVDQDPKLTPWGKHVSGIENIYRLLKSKGAGPTCWAMSEDSEIDGRELDLREALEHVSGRQIGTILSCVPGKLAYFESEDETLLLAR